MCSVCLTVTAQPDVYQHFACEQGISQRLPSVAMTYSIFHCKFCSEARPLFQSTLLQQFCNDTSLLTFCLTSQPFQISEILFRTSCPCKVALSIFCFYLRFFSIGLDLPSAFLADPLLYGQYHLFAQSPRFMSGQITLVHFLSQWYDRGQSYQQVVL